MYVPAVKERVSLQSAGIAGKEWGGGGGGLAVSRRVSRRSRRQWLRAKRAGVPAGRLTPIDGCAAA
jgi:hypothetical protein